MLSRLVVTWRPPRLENQQHAGPPAARLAQLEVNGVPRRSPRRHPRCDPEPAINHDEDDCLVDMVFGKPA